MDGCAGADSSGRRRFLLLRISYLLPDHPQVRLAEDQPCTGGRGLSGPRYGAVGHPPPRSRRGTLVRQAEEVMSFYFYAMHQYSSSIQPSVLGALQDCKQKQRMTLILVVSKRTGNSRWRGLSRPRCGCSGPK